MSEAASGFVLDIRERNLVPPTGLEFFVWPNEKGAVLERLFDQDE